MSTLLRFCMLCSPPWGVELTSRTPARWGLNSVHLLLPVLQESGRRYKLFLQIIFGRAVCFPMKRAKGRLAEGSFWAYNPPVMNKFFIVKWRPNVSHQEHQSQASLGFQGQSHGGSRRGAGKRR